MRRANQRNRHRRCLRCSRSIVEHVVLLGVAFAGGRLAATMARGAIIQIAYKPSRFKEYLEDPGRDCPALSVANDLPTALTAPP